MFGMEQTSILKYFMYYLNLCFSVDIYVNQFLYLLNKTRTLPFFCFPFSQTLFLPSQVFLTTLSEIIVLNVIKLLLVS